MSVNKPDISQIEKYLNGELDARAMHELERQALDDPFLADALDGYAQKQLPSTAHLQDLNSRLQQRVQPEAKRLSLLATLSIAATVLVFVCIGSWYWFIYQPSASVKGIPATDKTEVAKILPVPATKPAPITVQPELKPAAQQWAATKPRLRYRSEKKKLLADVKTDDLNSALAELPKLKADSGKNALLGRANLIATNGNSKQKSTVNFGGQLKDVVVIGYGTSQKRSVTTASVAAVKFQSIDSAISGRVAGLQVAARSAAPASSNEIRIRGNSSISKDKQPLYLVDGKPVDKIDKINSDAIASVEVLKDASATAIYGSRAANGVVIIKTKAPGLIKGQVISADNNEPIPGVLVKVKGTNKTVQTNADGKFTIDANKNADLVFTYIGYDTRELKIQGPDSLKVALNEDRRGLSEVAVISKVQQSQKERSSTQSLSEEAIQNKDSEVFEDTKAHPVDGWKTFNKYLKEKAKSPDGRTGVVRLSFTVNPNNTISDIKVLKSLSAEADAKAIEMIKDYRGWVAHANGTAETVKVKIRFSK